MNLNEKRDSIAEQAARDVTRADGTIHEKDHVERMTELLFTAVATGHITDEEFQQMWREAQHDHE